MTTGDIISHQIPGFAKRHFGLAGRSLIGGAEAIIETKHGLITQDELESKVRDFLEYVPPKVEDILCRQLMGASAQDGNVEFEAAGNPISLHETASALPPLVLLMRRILHLPPRAEGAEDTDDEIGDSDSEGNAARRLVFASRGIANGSDRLTNALLAQKDAATEKFEEGDVVGALRLLNVCMYVVGCCEESCKQTAALENTNPCRLPPMLAAQILSNRALCLEHIMARSGSPTRWRVV